MGDHSVRSNFLGNSYSSTYFSDLVDVRQGLDWHGPSAADAFAAVAALHDILCPGFVDWAYPRDTKLVIMGHSNGGQGAWYVASRWPDKVKAGMFDRPYNLRL
jgi:pimeloyl-ACP methyl ester carboxylesterase